MELISIIILLLSVDRYFYTSHQRKTVCLYLNETAISPLKVKIALTQKMSVQHHFIPILQIERIYAILA